MAYLNPTSSNGNGHTFPISRKAFHRGLPRRVGTIEDQLEGLERHLDGLERRLDGLVCRVTGIEARPVSTGSDSTALTARVDNLVEIVGRLEDRLRRIDKRSSQSRRKLAVIGDRVESHFE